MAKLKPGDRVDCRIKDNEIVNQYADYDIIRTFEIVSIDPNGYYLYVPPYFRIIDSFIATAHECKLLSIDKRFVNSEVVYVRANHIYKINTVFDGLKCSRCEDFVLMAGPNQEDGSFLCWSCRSDPYR